MNTLTWLGTVIAAFGIGWFIGRGMNRFATAFLFGRALSLSLEEWKLLPQPDKADTGRGVDWLTASYRQNLRNMGLGS